MDTATHWLLFTHRSFVRFDGMRTNNAKNKYYFGCHMKAFRSQDIVPENSFNCAARVDRVTCPKCLVALDRMLAENLVKVTAKKYCTFVGEASKHRYSVMTKNYALVNNG